MKYAAKFEKELDNLFRQRTHWLRHILVSPKPGPAPEFHRKELNDGIEKLQEIVLNALTAKIARKEFKKHAQAPAHKWKVKGHSKENKKQEFKEWLNHLNLDKGYIYVFWGKNRMPLYIGRTDKTGQHNRPIDHFNKDWFYKNRPVRIDIYQAKSNKFTPELECLAVHYFSPSQNTNKPAKRKYRKGCPLCEINKSIEDQLRDIFAFKKHSS